jgi:hypothetical protein
MISGALTLLTNAVIAYNTWKLHQRWSAAEKPASLFRATKFWRTSPYCLPTHQLSGHLSLSAGSLSWSASTVSTLSKNHRRSEMTYPKETVTFGAFR